MPSNFYVWAGVTKRELWTATGAMLGCPKGMRFLFFHGGQFHVVRRERVLADVCANAAAKPTTIREGSPLRFRSFSRKRKRRSGGSCACCQCCRHTCRCKLCVHTSGLHTASGRPSQRCITSADEKQPAGDPALNKGKTLPKNKLQQNPKAHDGSSTSTISSFKTDASKPKLQSDSVCDGNFHQKLKKNQEQHSPSGQHSRVPNLRLSAAREYDGGTGNNTNKDNPHPPPITSTPTSRSKVREASNVSQLFSKIANQNKRQARERETSQESLEKGEYYKELIVDESDVIAVRGLLEQHGPEDALLQFDQDDAYKRSLFCAINPIVNLERCADKDDLPLKHFASQLGLCSVTSTESTNSNPPAHTVIGTLKAYTALEDQAILQWVSRDDRARLVNGNQLWRRLEAEYCKLAGRKRPWQSLRNRYLRNLLPALGSMAVSPQRAAYLRAAAATGCFKRRKNRYRRNSIFGPAQTQAASARVPRRLHTPDSDGTENMPPASKRERQSTPPPSKRDRQSTPPPSNKRPRRGTLVPPPQPIVRLRRLFNPKKVFL